MKGIMCSSDVKTNDDYRKVLKIRNRWAFVLLAIGLIASISGYVMESTGISNVPSIILGFYSGVGTGIEIVGIIILVKNHMLLKNEEKLKEGRLSETDERLLEASNRALRTAFKFMLVAVSLCCMFGIIYPVIIAVILAIMTVFLIAFYASYSYYKKTL